MPKKPRVILSIELTAAAKRALERVVDASDMTQIAVLSRVIGWFAEAPDTVQDMILGRCPERYRRELTRLILQDMEAAD